MRKKMTIKRNGVVGGQSYLIVYLLHFKEVSYA